LIRWRSDFSLIFLGCDDHRHSRKSSFPIVERPRDINRNRGDMSNAMIFRAVRDQSDQFPRVRPTLIWTESIRRVWESRREWNAEVGQSAAGPVTTGDRVYLVHPRENPRWTSWEWCSINGYIAANSKVDVALEAALCRERSEPNSIKRVTSSRTTDAIFSERNSLSKHDGLLLSGDSARRWQNGTADGCESLWWMIVY